MLNESMVFLKTSPLVVAKVMHSPFTINLLISIDCLYLSTFQNNFVLQESTQVQGKRSGGTK